ncbi:polynucleotide adenylyltransferase [Blastocladiella emersonii ATCC 22665]|nr:polynucleotide adenylyltransferase [Blastocladiella emersonii ATCC 22665]
MDLDLDLTSASRLTRYWEAPDNVNDAITARLGYKTVEEQAMGPVMLASAELQLALDDPDASEADLDELEDLVWLTAEAAKTDEHKHRLIAAMESKEQVAEYLAMQEDDEANRATQEEIAVLNARVIELKAKLEEKIEYDSEMESVRKHNSREETEQERAVLERDIANLQRQLDARPAAQQEQRDVITAALLAIGDLGIALRENAAARKSLLETAATPSRPSTSISALPRSISPAVLELSPSGDAARVTADNSRAGPPKTALPAEHHHITTNATRFLGITQPVSLAGPDQRDAKLSADLVECLRSFDLFPSEDDHKLRERVLGKLYQLFRDFVKRRAIASGHSEDLAEECGGTIFSFGSFRLGVHGPGADVDTLCLAPRLIQREHFFTEMFEVLKGLPEVTELAAVPDAYVPVITMEFSGVPIDLLFARLHLNSVPDGINLNDNELLRHVQDERDVRSLNGSRVTDEILRLVPDVNEFRMALRAIKLWAKRRGIYSNVVGFFGGVVWAMLVARVCQLYPNANAGTIVLKFFAIMFAWKWPQPVLLKPIEEGPLSNVRIWNPKLYTSDRQHKMPVITPAYPSMCATHNVSESTMRILREEFELASKVASRILIGEAQWPALFAQHTFFRKYRYYLQIVASSGSKDRHLKWSGFVESRVRMLMQRLETMDDIEMVHPATKPVERQYACNGDEDRNQTAHGKWTVLPSPEPSVVAEAEAAGKPVIYTSSFYIGLLIKPAAPAAADGQPAAPRRTLNITWATREFQELVQGWESYDFQTMAITIQHVKKSDLPEDVAPKGTTAGKKRKATDAAAPATATAAEGGANAKRAKVAASSN